MVTTITVIAVLSLLIFFHELGHFSIAKLVGIRVHEFAIGMGPKFLQFTRGETAYSIRMLPIGGYVKMEGEDEASDDERSFSNKPVWARMAVIAAGPIMNFILAILLFVIASYFVLGIPTTVVGNVIKGTPAEAGGIQKGDKIIAINDVEIREWNQLVEEIANSNGKPTDIVLLRNNETRTIRLTPMKDEERGQFIIGIYPEVQKSFPYAVKTAFIQMKLIMNDIGNLFKKLVNRQVSLDMVKGPVGIVSLVGEATRAGWINVVVFAASFSVNLGLLNLFPIPALDGGRLIFLLFEFFRGKPIDPEKEGMIHFIGFALLMLLMVVITWHDIVELF